MLNTFPAFITTVQECKMWKSLNYQVRTYYYEVIT